MRPLRDLYGAAGIAVERHGTRQFLQETLQIPDIFYDHIIKELEEMQRQRRPDIHMVVALYQRLQRMCVVDAGLAEILRLATFPIPSVLTRS